MDRLNKLVLIALMASIALLTLYCAKPAFAPVPQVRNVVSYDVSGSTYLNVTIWHNINTTINHVDDVQVVLGANTTDLPIGIQNLAPDGTFNITYNMGPISGTPTITVKAHCIVDSWSVTNWTGQIPELSSALLMLGSVSAACLITFAIRKVRTQSRK